MTGKKKKVKTIAPMATEAADGAALAMYGTAYAAGNAAVQLPPGFGSAFGGGIHPLSFANLATSSSFPPTTFPSFQLAEQLHKIAQQQSGMIFPPQPAPMPVQQQLAFPQQMAFYHLIQQQLALEQKQLYQKQQQQQQQQPPRSPRPPRPKRPAAAPTANEPASGDGPTPHKVDGIWANWVLEMKVRDRNILAQTRNFTTLEIAELKVETKRHQHTKAQKRYHKKRAMAAGKSYSRPGRPRIRGVADEPTLSSEKISFRPRKKKKEAPPETFTTFNALHALTSAAGAAVAAAASGGGGDLNAKAIKAEVLTP